MFSYVPVHPDYNFKEENYKKAYIISVKSLVYFVNEMLLTAINIFFGEGDESLVGPIDFLEPRYSKHSIRFCWSKYDFSWCFWNNTLTHWSLFTIRANTMPKRKRLALMDGLSGKMRSYFAGGEWRIIYGILCCWEGGQKTGFLLPRKDQQEKTANCLDIIPKTKLY